jgi:exodeoxyribonuclease-1
METYLERASKVRENFDFRQRTSRLLAERYVDSPPAIYVEQRIYDGFPSHDDEASLAMFHRQDGVHRIDLLSSIEDERYRELGERVIATEQPQLLTATQRSRWQAWRRERILATGDTPWLTVADAMAELDELAVVGGQGHPLSDIRNLLRILEAKCAAE